MNSQDLKSLLDEKYEQFNLGNFIENDPVGIPHRFTQKQDIEIAGFFAAILAWGNRKSIISSCDKLMERMHNAPYDFILNHSDDDLKRLNGFVHRTFNDLDLFFLVEVFKVFYTQNDSLESLFIPNPGEETIESGLIKFHNYCFSFDFAPQRSKKHIATPIRNSACKRLNMYLRWMVRQDTKGVDFGIWKQIKPSQLICPLDVHVQKVAYHFGLIPDDKSNWKTALNLTQTLKQFDPNDPVKYDFALFGMGIEGFTKSKPVFLQ